MLAGYLPFDDDPANPEGDNINLLYKYIVSTPLTFPEYVTPHARDLLRRILVPDPRKRADLFEVARHSWLSEYSHVVGFIGSSTKSDVDIAASAMRQNDEPSLGRSASVREPTTRAPASAGGITHQSTRVEDAQGAASATTRDAKRRTVQVEYVAPRDSTTRSEASPAAASVASPTATNSAGKTRARGDSSGPVEVTSSTRREAPVPRKEVPPASQPQVMPPPSRPARSQIRAASDHPSYAILGTPSASRPNTSGTLGSARLPSRGNSYSQPAIATPTNTNAQAQFSRPKSGSGYIISGPIANEPSTATDGSRPASQQNLAQYQQQAESQDRSHKRSSTLGSIGDRLLGRSSSRSRRASQQPDPATGEKKIRKYPPVSMRNAMPYSNEDAQPRPSTESSRRPSFGFNRKTSDTASDTKRSSRRFSFLPSGFSMSSFTGKSSESRPASKGYGYGLNSSRAASESTNSMMQTYSDPSQRPITTANSQRKQSGTYEKALSQPPNQDYSRPGTTQTLSGLPASQSISSPSNPQSFSNPPSVQRKQYRDDGYGSNALEASQDPVERFYTPTGGEAHASPATSQQPQQQGYANYYDVVRPQQAPYSGQYQAAEQSGRQQQQQQPSSQFRPNQRNFSEQYDRGHSGSSSATRRVMDFFRRRAKERE